MKRQFGCTSSKVVGSFEVYIVRFRGDDTVYLKKNNAVLFVFTPGHILKGRPNLPVDLDVLRVVVEELMKELE